MPHTPAPFYSSLNSGDQYNPFQENNRANFPYKRRIVAPRKVRKTPATAYNFNISSPGIKMSHWAPQVPAPPKTRFLPAILCLKPGVRERTRSSTLLFQSSFASNRIQVFFGGFWIYKPDKSQNPEREFGKEEIREPVCLVIRQRRFHFEIP